jgi:hypothetical protein
LSLRFIKKRFGKSEEGFGQQPIKSNIFLKIMVFKEEKKYKNALLEIAKVIEERIK